jgi:hypothetical protein
MILNERTDSQKKAPDWPFASVPVHIRLSKLVLAM